MNAKSAFQQFNKRIGLTVFLALAASVGSAEFPIEPSPSPAPKASPWGVSSSAGSMRNHAEWLPKMASAGVSSVRLFPEWRSVERAKGTWNWSAADALVDAATANQIEITGILMGSPPGTKAIHAFPMDDLEGWSGFVAAAVGRFQKRIHYWEIWNEGNGGFNDGKHTTADYAKLATAAYAAAKKVDPNAKIGLTVASFDAPYLQQAMAAMAKQGQPGCFDHLCIHPYEIADNIADPDGEVPFLWMAHQLRSVLKVAAPDHANAEIWITEVGRRVQKKKDHNVTERDAAKALAKIYVMAIAQGIARTQWFEAQDPIGEDQGFGLLRRDGSPRPSFAIFKSLTSRLGTAPKYEGWLALGAEGKGYGFVFSDESKPMLIVWMPAGQTDKSLTFAGDVRVIDTLTGVGAALKAGQTLKLTDDPVLVVDTPSGLVAMARTNADKSFPWGGDFSTAKTVTGEPGAAARSQGIFQVQRDATPTVKFPDGSTGILVRGDQAVSFYCHPSFANLSTRDYYVRVSVRRVAPGNVGMNLNYEVADSQGRSPYKNRGQWFSVAENNDWQTHTCHVTDACFAKMWGYDIAFRPEQSVPFVIGKVEVSTEPFP